MYLMNSIGGEEGLNNSYDPNELSFRREYTAIWVAADFGDELQLECFYNYDQGEEMLFGDQDYKELDKYLSEFKVKKE